MTSDLFTSTSCCCCCNCCCCCWFGGARGGGAGCYSLMTAVARWRWYCCCCYCWPRSRGCVPYAARPVLAAVARWRGVWCHKHVTVTSLTPAACAEDWCYRLDRQLIYLTIDPPKCSLVVWYTVLISAGLFIKSAASRPYNILIQGCRYLLLLECTPDICWAMFWLSRPVKLSTIWLHCHSNQYISLLIKNGSVSWSLFFRVSDYCYHHVWQTISCCHHKRSR